MEIRIVLATVLISYLIGSISISRLISRLVAPDVNLDQVDVQTADGDIHRIKTIGATTASIKLGPKVGCTIGILDILKGVVPVLIFRLLYPDQYYHLIAAVFVVVGHNWSIFHRFTGGGGISPTYGGFFVVDWIGTIVSAFAGMLFGFFIVSDMIVAYMSGLWFMLIWLILFKDDWPYIVYGIVINIVFTLALIPDAKDYFKIKREGRIDMGSAMEATPMGRGMMKMMRWMGVDPIKKKTK